MTKYFYDTEFLEDGHTIGLISIGIVAEDGREYYAINANAPWDRVARHGWLVENVVPTLITEGAIEWVQIHPEIEESTLTPVAPASGTGFTCPAVKPHAAIADEVRAFLLHGISEDELRTRHGSCELWANYGAYDHVVLCQLWGRMIDLPEGVPMWTNDIRQECERLGNPEMPQQARGQHNALEDARHNKVMYEFLAGEAAA